MIPFNRTHLVGQELDYIRQSVASGTISGEGSFVKRCESLLEEILGNTSKVLLTPSCTDALEMCALLLDLHDGDEVIMPSYTFVSTAAAFALRNARPIFADVQRTDLNIDPDSIVKAISPRTKAIVVVHYGGVACNMDRIMAIAAEHGIPVIEDAAHALGSTFNSQPCGTFGSLATFSFHETKNVSCGEGGALVVNDLSLFERANVLRDKGTNRKQFQRGDAQFYSWVDLGSSFVMSDVLAAFLYAQLEHLEAINAKRRELVKDYACLFGQTEASSKLEMSSIGNLANSSAHLFYCLLSSHAQRAALISYLRKNDILAVSHYEPLHLSPYVVKRWGVQPQLPVTEEIAPRLLRLPLYNSLDILHQRMIVRVVEQFLSSSPN